MSRKLRLRTASSAMILLVLNGCASLFSDNDTMVYISTDPEPASCKVVGDEYFQTITTPFSVKLPANAAPVTVSCDANGYFTTTGTLDTEADGWIVANVPLSLLLLPLAPIGMAIDGARGAGMKYPSSISIPLDPNAFTDEGSRDDWYDARRTRIEEKWEAMKGEVKVNCEQLQTACNRKLEKLEEKKQEELTLIERRRSESEILVIPDFRNDLPI